MGKLIGLAQIRDQADFYFEDAHWSWEKRNYYFPWPNKGYPYHSHIHHETISNGIKIKIRKWVELRQIDTVIYDTVDFSYRHYLAPRYDWGDGYEIPNEWHRFSFSNEDDYLCFNITFINEVSPITQHHPRYPEHEEICKMTPEERSKYYEKARNNKKN